MGHQIGDHSFPIWWAVPKQVRTGSINGPESFKWFGGGLNLGLARDSSTIINFLILLFIFSCFWVRKGYNHKIMYSRRRPKTNLVGNLALFVGSTIYITTRGNLRVVHDFEKACVSSCSQKLEKRATQNS